MVADSPTISLVLGGGSARGLAHIGVIQWLTENGYNIRSISGSSMGALVGGIYATGKLERGVRHRCHYHKPLIRRHLHAVNETLSFSIQLRI